MNELFPLNSTNQLIRQYVSHDNAEFIADQSIQSVIQCFNIGVEKSFTVEVAQPLKDHCTAAHLDRMHKKSLDWKARDILVLKLVSCEYLAFNLAPDGRRARAFTFEKWIFCYADGREIPTTGSVDRYSLVLESGHWKVDSVDFFACETVPTSQ